MSLDTYDVRRAVHGYFGAEDDDFDEWMESHDAEVRNEAIIARDTRTPAELIQAAWDAAYPVPPNGRIPKGTKYLTRCGGKDVVTAEAGIDLRGGPDIRTLEPLPPLIPDDCMAVWASLKGLGDPQNPTRCVWLRDSGRHSWRNRWNVVAAEVDLIDPKPVPEEER
ncbi:hypothetical protein DUY81_13895 [Acidipropionibacterium acidipropionici]|uniref:Uncharacterized protein n=1 Tax=Acidipropionibacterium acidipropionici TaxID=1748 RepID=A0AAC9AP67_9ACTN|nr:hypothetical protein [Acidipropionibacterium acidipropionici]AMS06478.1 hypothetical protein AXH35_14470 [Acidipropionibacterium acidipropionici]AOZ47925.1 hypothetical protein A8L58_15925 [Acidipropionibacterium acidipropionici]AZP38729.1 hypothetical protein DUY81_13895 [Acidipropionibacterium acidipropionici]